MKISLYRRPIAGRLANITTGTIIEVPDKLGKELIEQGCAKEYTGNGCAVQIEFPELGNIQAQTPEAPVSEPKTLNTKDLKAKAVKGKEKESEEG